MIPSSELETEESYFVSPFLGALATRLCFYRREELLTTAHPMGLTEGEGGLPKIVSLILVSFVLGTFTRPRFYLLAPIQISPFLRFTCLVIFLKRNSSLIFFCVTRLIFLFYFRSAFFWFCNDERAQVKANNPDYGVGDIAKELGRKWADAEPHVKQKYEAMAEKDKARYERVKIRIQFFIYFILSIFEPTVSRIKKKSSSRKSRAQRFFWP